MFSLDVKHCVVQYLARLDLDGVPWVTREEVQDSLSLATWKKWGRKRTQALVAVTDEVYIFTFKLSCQFSLWLAQKHIIYTNCYHTSYVSLTYCVSINIL